MGSYHLNFSGREAVVLTVISAFLAVSQILINVVCCQRNIGSLTKNLVLIGLGSMNGFFVIICAVATVLSGEDETRGLSRQYIPPEYTWKTRLKTIFLHHHNSYFILPFVYLLYFV